MLTRELSSLRPEIDHLRSQAASNQSLLADKLLLQRQLSTIQVELENEQRSNQRIVGKESKSHAEVAKLESQIEVLQAELGKERRDWQKSDREAQKLLTESENKTRSLESHLETTKTKLKDTRDQLKENRLATENAQNPANTALSRARRPIDAALCFANGSRKRTAIHMDDHSVIGTPGDLPAVKKNKRTSSLVGEKSTFSITPFLNRTTNTVHESPSSQNFSGDGEACTQPEDPKPLLDKPKQVSKSLDLSPAKIGKKSQAEGPGILGSAKPSKINSRGVLGRKQKAVPILEQVEEEKDAENESAAAVAAREAMDNSFVNEAINAGAEIKKKKRKLLGGGLGRTLFDEDEGDAVKGDGGLSVKVKDFRNRSHGLAGPPLGPKKAVATSVGAFGAISPLKREMRSVV